MTKIYDAYTYQDGKYVLDPEAKERVQQSIDNMGMPLSKDDVARIEMTWGPDEECIKQGVAIEKANRWLDDQD